MTEQEPKNQPQQKADAIKMEIICDGNQVQVTGPLTNKLLCMGMLELAKQTVIEFNLEMDKKNKPKLTIVGADTNGKH